MHTHLFIQIGKGEYSVAEIAHCKKINPQRIPPLEAITPSNCMINDYVIAPDEKSGKIILIGINYSLEFVLNF